MTDEQQLTETAEPPDASGGTVAPARPSTRRRVLRGVAVAAVVLAAIGTLLYLYGGMGGSANDPEMKRQYEQLVASRQVAPVEKRFVIPIPGCTCHSDDPYRTEQHRNRRIRECMDCHGG